MDPYEKYHKQLEYYQYFDKQLENYKDLSKDLDNPNDSILHLADIVFSKSKRNLDQNLTGILVDETMETADIFCMLLELILHGINILSDGKNTFFDIDESTDDIIYTIKYYLRSLGFDMEFHEFFTEEENITLYRERVDYYYEIVPKPPPYLCTNEWIVLSYRMINNANFTFDHNTTLDMFHAFYITNQKQIFTISFKYYIKK